MTSRRPTFLICACSLLIGASALEMAGKHCFSEALILRVGSADQKETAQARTRAASLLRSGTRFRVTGTAVAGMGIFCWIVAWLRKERGTQAVPVSLAIVYVLLWFLMV